jgi:HTH-type transcriptional regulator, sugar sensing transcriptional regulator
MGEAAIQRLQVLGFSLYEARVYLGLLRHGPQNGNEVAKSAGLPSSKVYSTLKRLASKGIVHSVRVDSSTQYVCVSPDELMHRLRGDYVEPLEYLEKTLPGLAAFELTAEVLTVTGLDAIRENSRFIVGDARNEIYISAWSDDIEHLADALRIAHQRGVHIFGMLYGEEIPLDAGSWLAHSYRQIVSERIGGRMLTLVADGEEALIAHIPRRGDASAVRTRNPVLALITREYLHHDIVLQRAQIAIGFDEWDRWWQGDPDLRTIILSGRTVDKPARARKKKEARR